MPQDALQSHCTESCDTDCLIPTAGQPSQPLRLLMQGSAFDDRFPSQRQSFSVLKETDYRVCVRDWLIIALRYLMPWRRK